MDHKALSNLPGVLLKSLPLHLQKSLLTIGTHVYVVDNNTFNTRTSLRKNNLGILSILAAILKKDITIKKFSPLNLKKIALQVGWFVF